MKKILLTLVACLIAFNAFAKSEYIYTDHRFNFVKMEDMSAKEAAKKAPTHPYTISEEQMRVILKDLKLSRGFIIKKDVEDQDVFNERGINFLALKLSDAFSRATDKQKIVFSYLSKEPLLILRNDRITIGSMWMKGDKMYVTFEKLMAKLLGDTDKKGDFAKIIGRAKGLRIELELDACQSYGDTKEEIVIDTACALGNKTPEAVEEPAKIEKAKKEEKVAPPPAPVAPMTTRERLKELQQLKDDGLITESEFNRKKRDILKGL